MPLRLKVDLGGRSLRRIANSMERIADSMETSHDRLDFVVGPFSTKGRNQTMKVLLTNEQKVQVSIAPTTESGNPAPVDGVPQWSSDDTSVATVEPAADGMSAMVVSGNPGTTMIRVSADADMDEGETRELTGELEIEIQVAEATSLGFGIGTPEPK